MRKYRFVSHLKPNYKWDMNPYVRMEAGKCNEHDLETPSGSFKP